MKNNDGFTLVETLVSITLILVVCGALGGGLYAALRSLEHAGKAGGAAYRLLRMDDTIRAAAAEVVLPYWAPARQGGAVFQQKLDANPATAGLHPLATRRNGAIVRYEVDGKDFEATVVFGYRPVMEEER